jgi:hypothetical protein
MNDSYFETFFRRPFEMIYDDVYSFLLSLIVCIVQLFLFSQTATFLSSMLMGKAMNDIDACTSYKTFEKNEVETMR